ncbi:periplasmic heavy metal sensor [Porphyrobacter algicida]|uniref:Periplasmic heavy metal sensor n=1 Tax=Qipengyuania algicida TaxID=1836209 RepID=A0A845AIV8_9SPHN|nr:periplasmic heavy metal sensor [Qipengyuania algicida]MXP28476.1 periplasmic heavy metal sensor [Qipengyuania algicida]
MKFGGLHVILAVLLAAVAGCVGAVIAGHWRDSEKPRSLHAFVHHELHLDTQQNAKLEQLEAKFAVQKRQLDLSLRAANANLGAAMSEEHQYGPKVAVAIDQVHARMGDVQKATVRHVFAMRALLTPAQQERFDREVAASLTAKPGD